MLVKEPRLIKQHQVLLLLLLLWRLCPVDAPPWLGDRKDAGVLAEHHA